VSFPLAPFLGILGVAVAGHRRPHSMLPGPDGGNIDVNLLMVGATPYLPVQVEGALAYVGDPHFAQGDGEMSLTAMEASLRATVRLDVVACEDAVGRCGALAGPVGVDPRMAYASLSAATDFDISQVVDVVKGVHARIRKSDLAEVRR
jgi:acetamidase/formamidase